jgi:hypothetical protein
VLARRHQELIDSPLPVNRRDLDADLAEISSRCTFLPDLLPGDTRYKLRGPCTWGFCLQLLDEEDDASGYNEQSCTQWRVATSAEYRQLWELGRVKLEQDHSYWAFDPPPRYSNDVACTVSAQKSFNCNFQLKEQLHEVLFVCDPALR